MSETRVPNLDDFEGAEHCVLEDVTIQHPALPESYIGPGIKPREVAEEVEIRDQLRGRYTTVTIYAEGWADIEVVRRRGKTQSQHSLNLQFLDATPTISKHYPIRLLKAAGIAAGVTALFAIPAWFGWLSGFFLPAAISAGVVTALTLFVTFYMSHEKIRFHTLHGRADAVRFGAGLGTIRRFRKLVPKLTEAIGNAAESVHDETAVYLRAEMREHYRLRSDGIISESECAESTGRILANFDGPIEP